MEYDFSKIKTEELRRAVFKEGCCWGIDCEPCPFCGKPGDVSACDTDKDDIKRLFKSELNRREKMENKMPTIVSGMIVELECGDVAIALPNKENVSLYYKNGKDVADYNVDIKRIYFKKDGRHYGGFFSKDFLESLDISKAYNLIWSKKSDKDIKIEELEKTIKKAQEQIQELKG